MDLKTRFSLYFVCILALGLVALSVFSVLNQAKLIETEVEMHSVRVINRIAIEFEKSYAQTPLPDFRKDLALDSEEGFLSAYITDEKGRAVYHSSPVMVGSVNPFFRELTSEYFGDVYVRRRLASTNVPVIGFTKRIQLPSGEVRWIGLLIRQRPINTRIRDILINTSYHMLFLVLTLVFLSIGAAVILSKGIAKPLKAIGHSLKHLGSGRYEPMQTQDRGDEIGHLSSEFNVTVNKLKELDEMKREFASMVTHELRSPLTAINQLVSLLLKNTYGKLSKDQRESLLIVKNNSVRLADFIDELLTTSKIDAGKTDLFLEDFDVRDLLLSLSKLYAPSFKEKKIELKLKLGQDVNTFVRADRDKCLQIMDNLISNALKFTDKGAVVVTIKEQSKFVEIAVADTGPGLSAADRDKVFDKFFRAAATSKTTKGTGLGLSIVKSFVDLQKGTIRITENAPQGCVFTVALPKAGETDRSISD